MTSRSTNGLASLSPVLTTKPRPSPTWIMLRLVSLRFMSGTGPPVFPQPTWRRSAIYAEKGKQIPKVKAEAGRQAESRDEDQRQAGDREVDRETAAAVGARILATLAEIDACKIGVLRAAWIAADKTFAKL